MQHKYYWVNRVSVFAMAVIILSGCAPITALTTTIAAGRSVTEERKAGDIVDDIVINSKIRARFSTKDFNNIFAKVSVSSTEGRVLLAGGVESMEYAAQAVEISWTVPGVKEVINEIQIENISIGTMAKDSWIATRIKSKLFLDKDVKSVNYSVEVNNGIVYLTGIAQDQIELSRAEELASFVKGVTKVISHVVMKDDPRRNPKFSG